jgi:leader peptidase (prepilin peptidase)/N-methyltransferase
VLSAAVYLAIGCGLILLLINYQNAWSFWPIFKYIYPFLAPALIASSIFGLIYILSHGTWMGAGDIEIVFLMGLFLGWPNTAIAFYVAFISGAIIGVILLIIQRAKLKTEVAFGPFLIFGTFVAFLCSTQIISFYDRIFLGF